MNSKKLKDTDDQCISEIDDKKKDFGIDGINTVSFEYFYPKRLSAVDTGSCNGPVDIRKLPKGPRLRLAD